MVISPKLLPTILASMPMSNTRLTTAMMKTISSTSVPAKPARILRGRAIGRDEEIRRLAATTCEHRPKPERMLQ